MTISVAVIAPISADSSGLIRRRSLLSPFATNALHLAVVEKGTFHEDLLVISAAGRKRGLVDSKEPNGTTKIIGYLYQY